MKFKGEDGNAAIELILVAPLLLALLAVVVASGRILSTKSALESVVRESARAASGESDAIAADYIARQRGAAVASGLGLDPSRLQLTVNSGSFGRGTPLTVEARYGAELSDLPGFGFFPGSFELSARHVELLERYGSR